MLSVWPALAILLYLMLVSVSRVLLAQIDHHLGVHNRVRESKLMRTEYLEEMARQRFKSVEFEE